VTLAVDALSAARVPLAILADSTRDALRRLAGEAAAVTNPIDLAGAPDQQPLVFSRALETLVADAQVGAVLVTGLFGGYAIRFDPSLETDEVEAARQIAALAASSRKPVMVHTLYGSTPSHALDELRRSGVPVLRSLDVACRCVVALHRRSGGNHEPRGEKRPEPAHMVPLGAPTRRAPTFLVEPDARALLAQHGVPLVPATFCRSAAEVRDAVRRHGAPVALKAVSPYLPHKTDAGGVRLGITGPEAAAVFEDMVKAVRVHLVGRAGKYPPRRAFRAGLRHRTVRGGVHHARCAVGRGCPRRVAGPRGPIRYQVGERHRRGRR